MNTTDTIQYLEGLTLVNALFWFIENSEGLDSSIFFYLRERVRLENIKL